MKRKHLLFKEAVCKNRISLIKLFVNRNLCLSIFPYIYYGMSIAAHPEASRSITHFRCKKEFFYKIQYIVYDNFF